MTKVGLSGFVDWNKNHPVGLNYVYYQVPKIQATTRILLVSGNVSNAIWPEPACTCMFRKDNFNLRYLRSCYCNALIFHLTMTLYLTCYSWLLQQLLGHRRFLSWHSAVFLSVLLWKLQQEVLLQWQDIPSDSRKARTLFQRVCFYFETAWLHKVFWRKMLMSLSGLFCIPLPQDKL